MLDHFRQLAIFAKAVETGSFRGAADALELSPSVVSHHISKLEEGLGAALLYRSTRKLSLTQDGERLLAAAQEMVAAAERGFDSVNAGSLEPSGRLKITAPAVLAHSAVLDRIAGFAKAYPKIDLDVSFTDVRRDIIAEGIDVAVRMGWLKDSSLKARKVAAAERVLVAAPAYLEGRETPQSAQDLTDCRFVCLTAGGRRFEFQDPAGRKTTITADAYVFVDQAFALYRLVLAGAGVGSVPKFLAADDIAAGKVIELLPGWRLQSLGVYAVWPPNTPRASLTSLFVKLLAEPYRDAEGLNAD